MSDDEVQYAKKKKVVHYGGLDELPVKNDTPPPGENENIQVVLLFVFTIVTS